MEPNQPKKCRLKWLCKCDCGNESIHLGSNMKRGISKSCGCLKNSGISNFKHGLSDSKFHKSWSHMKGRCLKPSDNRYNLYGGRGIKVCDEWLDFKNFQRDMYESFLKHSLTHDKKNTQLDRIDNNGNYCKENCRWATQKEQQNNRRNNRLITFKNETHTTTEWSEILNIPYSIIEHRLNRGHWTVEETFTTYNS